MSFLSILKKPFTLYLGLPRDIYFIFIARVVTSIGNFVFPFLTLILTEKLGMSTKAAGDILFISFFAFLPGTLLGGKLADAMGRKKLILVSQFLFASMYIGAGFVGVSQQLLYFIIPANFFMGTSFPAMQALTMDIAPREQRQAAFSLMYLGHNFGLALGPSIAGFLFNNYFRVIFFGDALTTFASLVLIALFVSDRKFPDSGSNEIAGAEAEAENAVEGSVFSVLLRRPNLMIFIFIAMILNFVYVQHTFTLPLFMSELFGDRGPRYYGFIMTFNACVVLFVTPFAVSLTKKINPVFNLCLVALFYAIGFGMIAFLFRLPLFFLSTLIWTTGEILATTNKQVYVANHTPVSHRGRVNAVLPIVAGIAFASSPVFTGRYIEVFSVRSVWPIAAGLALIGLFGFTGLFLFEKGKKEKGDSSLIK